MALDSQSGGGDEGQDLVIEVDKAPTGSISHGNLDSSKVRVDIHNTSNGEGTGSVFQDLTE